jgi:hypothetical protein
VSVFYVFFRLIFNLINGRGLLLNWGEYIFQSVIIILFSYFIYIQFIANKQTLLPDLANITNELWILIMLFLYKILNDISISDNGTKRRKNNYCMSMLKYFKKKYGHIIDKNINNDYITGLTYAILIIENYNRPKTIRILEYINFFFGKKPMTLGVMQYSTSEYINDKKSVQLGIEKIKNDYKMLISKYNRRPDQYHEYIFKRELSNTYNSGDEYSSGVIDVWDFIMENEYRDTTDGLFEQKRKRNIKRRQLCPWA